MTKARRNLIDTYGRDLADTLWRQGVRSVGETNRNARKSIEDIDAGSRRKTGNRTGGGGRGPSNSNHRPSSGSDIYIGPDGRLDGFDPVRNFRFRVKIQPYSAGIRGWDDDAFPAYIGFTSVAGLSTTMTSIPLTEGGLNTITHQLPGLASYSPITFQKGIFLGDEENWQWLRRITGTIGNAGYGAPGGNFRCAVKIDVLSHPNPGSRALGGGGSERSKGQGFLSKKDILGTEVLDDHASISFLLSKAWITTLAYSDLNAGDSALVVEQMTLVHEGIHMDWASDFKKKLTADAFDGYEGIPTP